MHAKRHPAVQLCLHLGGGSMSVHCPRRTPGHPRTLAAVLHLGAARGLHPCPHGRPQQHHAHLAWAAPSSKSAETASRSPPQPLPLCAPSTTPPPGKNYTTAAWACTPSLPIPSWPGSGRRVSRCQPWPRRLPSATRPPLSLLSALQQRTTGTAPESHCRPRSVHEDQKQYWPLRRRCSVQHRAASVDPPQCLGTRRSFSLRYESLQP
mmetsp:Transcript_58239/g.155626  ORF Transcript_58239/g.155626 Transcript_58239/m.155626 type:complete len:208 (+) Transcript_58239:316-939(+)